MHDGAAEDLAAMDARGEPTSERPTAEVAPGADTLAADLGGDRALRDQGAADAPAAPLDAPRPDAGGACALPCATASRWALGAPAEVGAFTGGGVSLVRAVATPSGWGLFWQRDEPSAPRRVRVFFAAVDARGAVTAGPVQLVELPRLDSRTQYYSAAWSGDRFGLLVHDNTAVAFYTVTPSGALGPRVSAGPRLMVSTVYSSEARGQLTGWPGGFLGVLEGDCAGHSCAYAFRLGPTGAPMGSVQNLVDMDFTHQFWPVAAFDGAGFAILSVKDVTIPRGGVTTRYLSSTGALSSPNVKVVPMKEYLWDENPDLAWSGTHFGALWTEVTARPPSGRPPVSWQVHFATFRRGASASTLLRDRVLEVTTERAGHGFSTQLHAVGCDWLAQYARWRPGAEPQVVFQWLDDAGAVRATLTPFTQGADALGSSPALAPAARGSVGVARGARDGDRWRLLFHLLEPPSCGP
ncbi:MAG: hypothetical protein HY909_26470 [Deltaproteobacteria bacterium]|nr:hypothetical protein [Deltaproteobacteria bacterium]